MKRQNNKSRTLGLGKIHNYEIYCILQLTLEKKARSSGVSGPLKKLTVNPIPDSALAFCSLSLNTNHIFFLGLFFSLYQILKYRLDILGWLFHTVQSHWDSQPGVKPLRSCWLPSSSQPPFWLPEHADFFSHFSVSALSFDTAETPYPIPSQMKSQVALEFLSGFLLLPMSISCTEGSRLSTTDNIVAPM